MVRLKHWQDVVNAVLGVWLMASPWALGYAAEPTATVNAFVIGMALLATALGAVFLPAQWEEWTEVFLGLWLLVSPWALAISGERAATICAVITGLAIIGFAAWTLMTDRDYLGWVRDKAAH